MTVTLWSLTFPTDFVLFSAFVQLANFMCAPNNIILKSKVDATKNVGVACMCLLCQTDSINQICLCIIAFQSEPSMFRTKQKVQNGTVKP